MTKFKEQYPDVVLSLHVGDTREIINKVLRGELTLGVVGAKEDQPELVYTPLLKDELVVLAAPQLFNGHGPLTLDKLTEWPWVMREKGSGTRISMEKGLADAGFDAASLKSTISVDSTEALLRFLRAGLGLGMTSRIAAREYIEKGELVEVQVQNFSLQRNFYSVYHSQRHFFPAARYFINYLESEGEKIMAGAK